MARTKERGLGVLVGEGSAGGEAIVTVSKVGRDYRIRWAGGRRLSLVCVFAKRREPGAPLEAFSSVAELMKSTAARPDVSVSLSPTHGVQFIIVPRIRCRRNSRCSRNCARQLFRHDPTR
jgi:hypothetical protein